jgi:hypothetical protein
MSVRRVLAVVIATALSSGGMSVTASAAPAATESSDVPAFVSISIAETVRPTDVAQAWVSDGVQEALASASISATDVGSRELVVELGGKALAYEVSVGVRQDGSWIAGPTTSPCSCHGDDLVAHVRTAVAGVAPKLRADEVVDDPGSSATPPPELRPPVEDTSRAERRPLGKMGGAGVALVVVGGAATIAGVALLAIPVEDAHADDPERTETASYRVPGGVVLGVGLATLVVGAALLGTDRAHAKRRASALAPSFGRRWVGVSWTTRF